MLDFFLCVCVCVQSFPVRSLGWVEMAEQDLCEGRSSVAVHHCIRQLSYCRRDIRDSAGVWGEVSVSAGTVVTYMYTGCIGSVLSA